MDDTDTELEIISSCLKGDIIAKSKEFLIVKYKESYYKVIVSIENGTVFKKITKDEALVEVL